MSSDSLTGVASKEPALSETQSHLLVFALLILVPLLAYPTSFAAPVVSVASYALVYMIAAQALSLQVGYTGLLNLGLVAFVGLGAYVAAILLSIPAGHKADLAAFAMAGPSQAWSASADGQVLGWNLDTRGCTGALPRAAGRSPVVAIASSPDGQLLAVAHSDKTLGIYDAQAGALLGGARGRRALDQSVSALAFTSAGQLLIGYEFGELEITAPRSCESAGRARFAKSAIRRIIVDSAESMILASEDGQVERRRIKASATEDDILAKLRLELGVEKLRLCAAASYGDTRLALGFNDGRVRIYEWATGDARPQGGERLQRELRFHEREAEALAFSADGKSLAVASRDRRISLWQVADGAQLKLFEGHLGAVLAVGFREGDGELVSASSDRSVMRWSLKEAASWRLPVDSSALVAFFKRLLPEFKGAARPLFFFLDPNLLVYLTVLPFTLIACSLLGLAIGIPTLRLRGDYFAIVTLGLAEILRLIIRNEDWLTSGPAGIKDLPPIVSFASGSEKIPFFALTAPYILGLVFFAISLYLMIRIRESRLGRAFMAVRDNELAAQSNGIDLAQTKVASFLISACVAALAGVLMVARVQVIGPNDLLFMESVLYLCCIVLGGLGSVRGAVLGGLAIGCMGEVMRQVLAQVDGVPAQVRYILFGVVLILVMRYRPEGFAPAADEERERGLRGAERDHEVKASLFRLEDAHGAA